MSSFYDKVKASNIYVIKIYAKIMNNLRLSKTIIGLFLYFCTYNIKANSVRQYGNALVKMS